MILEYNSIPIQPTEYVKYGATVDPRNEMKNMTPNNLTNESTATVKKTAPKINEMLNETPNKKIEMLNNQASTKEKEVKKTPHPITISESVSVPINHDKSGTKPPYNEIKPIRRGTAKPPH
jgi:stress response protein YsnF